MRRPTIRWTVRRMMIVVAIAAIALEGWNLQRRYAYHRAQAATIARSAAGLRRLIAKLPPSKLASGTSLDFEDGSPAVPATPDACERFLIDLDQSVRWHEDAARHPWRSVAPAPR